MGKSRESGEDPWTTLGPYSEGSGFCADFRGKPVKGFKQGLA